ncbi:c-type cytochrome [Plastorhodobacter daqingensis]|uniref:C-type cytochrome n=1 Tax=Plastorhodobacter daqingensis TaxID=1387281 RepID=A0ABW2UFF3_9RHOB
MDFKRKRRPWRLLRLIQALIVLGLILGATALWVARPVPLPDDHFAGLTGDAARGETVFWASGCASCHAEEGAEGDARLILTGGRQFVSDFGTFVAPNISSDPVYGIGGWTVQDLGNAVLRGVAPDGRHYYPAFPYASYARMTPQDLVDLHAFMATLPASNRPNEGHDLAMPFAFRPGIGLWKRFVAHDEGWVVTDALSPQEKRGRYLAEGLAHCGECHTPRTALGGLDRSRWFAGAPNPSGEGRIPNISPALLRWSEEDLVAYFTYGLTPDFDSAGGSMTDVIHNLARLPESDRAAIAAYLQKVRPVQ